MTFVTVSTTRLVLKTYSSPVSDVDYLFLLPFLVHHRGRSLGFLDPSGYDGDFFFKI